VDVADPDETVRIQNVSPRLSAAPGEIRWVGAALGAHNEAIFCGDLGLSATQLEELSDAGVI